MNCNVAMAVVRVRSWHKPVAKAKRKAGAEIEVHGVFALNGDAPFTLPWRAAPIG
jgi:hypothetical protein